MGERTNEAKLESPSGDNTGLEAKVFSKEVFQEGEKSAPKNAGQLVEKYATLSPEQSQRILERAQKTEPVGLDSVSTNTRLREAVALYRSLDPQGKGSIKDAEINRALANPNLSNRQLQWLLSLRSSKEDIKKLDQQDGSSDISAGDYHKFLEVLRAEKPRAPFMIAGAAGQSETGLSEADKSRLFWKFNSSMHYYAGVDHEHVEERIWGEFANPVEAIHPDAIKQTGLGSCFLSATLKALAKSNPALLASLIKDNKDGSFTVTFPGAPDEAIRVSAPSRAEISLANEGSKYGSWPTVLLKAYGQYRQANMWRRFVYGTAVTGFDADGVDKGGNPADAFTLLTGRKGESLFLARDGKDAIRAKLMQAFSGTKLSPLVATSLEGESDQHRTADGINRNHAYTITGFDPEGPDGGTVQLRNPWAIVKSDETLSFDSFLRNFRGLSYPVEDGENSCTFGNEERIAVFGGELALSLIPTLKVGSMVANFTWRNTNWGIGRNLAAQTAGQFPVVSGSLFLSSTLIYKYEQYCISSKYAAVLKQN